MPLTRVDAWRPGGARRNRSGRLDLGVLASDRRVAEDADLGALVQAQAAPGMGQQVDAPLLAAALHLDPGAAQDLLDQGQAQAQARAQDHDPHGLAHVEAIGQRDSQPLEQEAADEPAQAAADQAVDQALARPVGQTLAQSDPQSQHRPRESPAQETAAQETDHDLAGHQADRTPERRRRRSPGQRRGPA